MEANYNINTDYIPVTLDGPETQAQPNVVSPQSTAGQKPQGTQEGEYVEVDLGEETSAQEDSMAGSVNLIEMAFGPDVKDGVTHSTWINDKGEENVVYKYTDKNGEEHRVNFCLRNGEYVETSRVTPNGDGTHTRGSYDKSGERYQEIFTLNEDKSENRLAKFFLDHFSTSQLGSTPFKKSDGKYSFYDKADYSEGIKNEKGALWVNGQVSVYKPCKKNEQVELGGQPATFSKVGSDATITVGGKKTAISALMNEREDGVYTIGNGENCDIALDGAPNGTVIQVVKNGDNFYVMGLEGSATLKAGESTYTTDKSGFDYTQIITDPYRRQAMQNVMNSGEYSDEELKQIARIFNKEIELCTTKFTGAEYDKLNNIAFGEVKDPNLKAKIDSIAAKYNIEIKYDNDIQLATDARSFANWTGFSSDVKFMTAEDLEAMDAALAQMQHMGQKIPDTIYMTKLFSVVKKDNYTGEPSGVYCKTTPNAITVNVSTLTTPDALKNTIYHESAHMADCNNATGNNPYYSRNSGLEVDKNFSSPDVNAEDIKYYCGQYALTSTQEFVAEITAMITSETIIQLEDGTYTINPDKIDNKGVYKNPKGKTVWSGNEDDARKLNAIMAMYLKATDGKITTVKRAAHA